tara:strand:+ start:6626 stop:7564 length:939 start_codon:yes stop_codon:yes gene_type:complete
MADDNTDLPSEDDWLVDPNQGVDDAGLPVSRDPSRISDPVNPYDDALLGSQPVDDAGLPISTPDTPNNPAPSSPEPMKDGLEDDDPPEDDPPEDEKPPVQRLPNLKPVRLPGAKGPLEVDSIGDYLEDADWQAIDSNARASAQQNYPSRPEPDAEPQPQEDPEPPQKNSENPYDPLYVPSSEDNEDDTEDSSDNASRVDDSMSGMANVPDTKPPKTFTVMPQGGQGNAEHIASQQSVDLADYGTQGTTSFDIPGQASSAKDDAVQKASDSINTATGRMVDLLQGLAQAMNAHSHRIAQIEDQLDMESERDVG